MRNELFDKVVSITEEYLGPAAPRFVTRQVSHHLGKSPDELSREDLPRLAEWTKVTFALLTDNKAMVKEYEEKIINLRI